MRILLLTAFLCAGLAACTQPNTPADTDSTGAAVPDPAMQDAVVPESLVGRWANQNGTYVDFSDDGTLAVTGRDQRSLFYRVLGDSLVVSDSAIVAVAAIPPADRYHFQMLSENELLLEPTDGALGGSYIRDAMPADSLAM